VADRNSADRQTGMARQNTVDLRRKKIQAIYNGKSAPITMQGLATATEKPPAQKQWKTIEKTIKNNAQNNGNRRKSGRVLASGSARLRSSDVAAWGRWRPNEKARRGAGDNSHKSETRISAIADFVREGKQEKKATFMDDLRSRLANRVQLVSDGFRAYLGVIPSP
jgi:hypothetical protein